MLLTYAWEDYMFKNQLEFSTGLTLLCDFTDKIQFASQNGVRCFMKSQKMIKQHKFQEEFYKFSYNKYIILHIF